MSMRTLVVRILLCTLALAASGAALAGRTAFQARCEGGGGKDITVLAAKKNPYTVNNTLSYKALTQMRPTNSSDVYVLGLTETEARVSVGLDGMVLQDPNTGYECVAPKIDIDLFYVPIVIYVGREFKPGSCAYREILAHEMRHLNTYLDHLPKVEALVRGALTKRFQSKPLYAPLGQTSAMLQSEIDTGWMPFIQTELRRVELQQVAIDTAEEYTRLSGVCQGEVQSILGTMQQTKK